MDIGEPQRVIEVAPPQEFPVAPVEPATEPIREPELEPVPADA